MADSRNTVYEIPPRQTMLKQLLTVVFLLSAGTLWAQQAAGLLPVQEDTHCKEWVEQTLSRMKLKDKVGQLFVYTLDSTSR